MAALASIDSIEGKGQIRQEYAPVDGFISLIDPRTRNILVTFSFSLKDTERTIASGCSSIIIRLPVSLVSPLPFTYDCR